MVPANAIGEPNPLEKEGKARKRGRGGKQEF